MLVLSKFRINQKQSHPAQGRVTLVVLFSVQQFAQQLSGWTIVFKYIHMIQKKFSILFMTHTCWIIIIRAGISTIGSIFHDSTEPRGRADLNLQCHASGIWLAFELTSRAYLQVGRYLGSGMATGGDGHWRWPVVGLEKVALFNVHGWNMLFGEEMILPHQFKRVFVEYMSKESLMSSRSSPCFLIWMIMAQCVVLFSTRRPKPSFLLNVFLHHQLVNWSLQFFGHGFFAVFGHSCWILLCLLRYHATRSKTYVYESYKLYMLYVFLDGKEVMMMFPSWWESTSSRLYSLSWFIP